MHALAEANGAWWVLGVTVVAALNLVGILLTRRTTKRVEYQLKPNGGQGIEDGGTVADALIRIEGKVDGLVNELVREKVRAQVAEAEISARVERLEP